MKNRIGIFLLIILILGIAPVGFVASSTLPKAGTLPKGVSLEITNVDVAGGRHQVAVGEVFDIFVDAKYFGMPDHTQVDMALFSWDVTGAHTQILGTIYTEYVTGSGQFGNRFSASVQEAGLNIETRVRTCVGLWTSLVS